MQLFWSPVCADLLQGLGVWLAEGCQEEGDLLEGTMKHRVEKVGCLGR
jgi:hypothetical protein